MAFSRISKYISYVIQKVQYVIRLLQICRSSESCYIASRQHWEKLYYITTSTTSASCQPQPAWSSIIHLFYGVSGELNLPH
jgi:hypothetical protein